MLRKCALVIGALAFVGLGCGDESSGDMSLVGPDGGPAAPSAGLAGPITVEQAKQIALAAVPGGGVGTEAETEDGRDFIEIEIRTADGVRSVEMDAATGEVVEIENEDDEDEDGDDD